MDCGLSVSSASQCPQSTFRSRIEKTEKEKTSRERERQVGRERERQVGRERERQVGREGGREGGRERERDISEEWINKIKLFMNFPAAPNLSPTCLRLPGRRR